MVQKQVVQLVDDIDGTEAHQTVHFSIDGKNYIIDLHNGHAAQLRDALGRYTKHARVNANAKAAAAPKVRGVASAQAAAKREHLAAVRVWARANGYVVNERGRIPDNILEAYAAAHK
jgi:hypothetical protein